MSGSMTVRPAGVGDAQAIAVALAEASLDEAVVGWVVPDERVRRERFTSGEAQTVAWVHGALATSEIIVAADDSGEIAGVSVWEFEDAARPAPETGRPT